MSKNQIAELDEQGLIGLVIEKMNGREIICKGNTLIDFATTNYLGFETRSELHVKGIEYASLWGATIGWSRLEADCHLYSDVERKVAEFVGAKKVHLSLTVTTTGFSLMCLIAKKGVILADQQVHSVVFESARLARDHGAAIVPFRHQDLAHLETLLKTHDKIEPKIIVIDGVYSISSEKAPIAAIQELAKRYNAWIYVDDAHGSGIYGKGPFGSNSYGNGGGGIVSHFTQNYSRTFYVGSFNKAFCTTGAFLVIPDEYLENVPSSFLSTIYSAPVAPYVLGTIAAALELNQKIGDEMRAHIRKMTQRFVDGLTQLGLKYTNESLHPVVFVEVGELPDLISVASFLKKNGVWAGLRPHPVVPKDRCGLRFAVTALHSEAHIDRALVALKGCQGLFKRRAA